MHSVARHFRKVYLDDIFWNKKYHGEHIDGDNGYQFEKIDEMS